MKDHGEGGNIIGHIEGDVFIDDVLSAGTAAKEAINTEQSGTQPAKYVLVGLVVKRKVKVNYLPELNLNLSSILKYSQLSKLIH